MKALNENPNAKSGSGSIDMNVIVECFAEGNIFAQGLSPLLLHFAIGLCFVEVFLCNGNRSDGKKWLVAVLRSDKAQPEEVARGLCLFFPFIPIADVKATLHKIRY